MTAFCPQCGFNIKADKPVERDGWRIVPGMAFYHGAPVALTASMATILHTLAMAAPDPVRTSVLENRSARGRYGNGSLKVVISELRKRLGDLSPIETVAGFGYRWREND